MISDLPAGLAHRHDLLLKPQPDARLIRPVVEKKPSGHFLSIIAFDGNITLQTCQSVLQAQHNQRLWRGWKFHMGEGQARSRNQCAWHFLNETDCEYHDLLDADLMFLPKHWQSLRAHPEAKDSIMCGAYPKKQEKIEFCYNPRKEGPFEPDARGVLEVAKAGTGFMQIPRSVYLRMQEAYPDLWYQCDYNRDEKGEGIRKFAFFCEKIMMDEDAGYVRHLTEDWMFCYLARKIGIRIFVDFTTTTAPWVQHRGAVLYPLPAEIERERVTAELEEARARIAQLEGKNAA